MAKHIAPLVTLLLVPMICFCQNKKNYARNIETQTNDNQVTIYYEIPIEEVAKKYEVELKIKGSNIKPEFLEGVGKKFFTWYGIKNHMDLYRR